MKQFFLELKRPKIKKRHLGDAFPVSKNETT